MNDGLEDVFNALPKLGVSTLQISMGSSWDGVFQIDAQQQLTDQDNKTSSLRHWFSRNSIMEAAAELKARCESASKMFSDIAARANSDIPPKG